jgi:hypothetical protein
MKSSQERGHQIQGVISARFAEKLLTDWVNLLGEWPRLENDESLRQTSEQIDWICRWYPDVFEDCPPLPTVVLREILRKAWDAPDLRHRDWFMFKFRDYYQQTVLRVQAVRADLNPGQIPPEMPVIVPSTRDEVLESTGPRNDPPPITLIEAVAFYFQRNANRARRCPNPECEFPYFLARKKGQKYCSEKCAKPARRESKRKWWSENRGKLKSK